MILIKRAYEKPDIDDGTRILVDRLWPRGIKKEELKLDYWLKDVAPSDGLRKWSEFCRRYSKELDQHPEALKPIQQSAGKGTVTLIYSAKDEEHNNAAALKGYLDSRLSLD